MSETAAEVVESQVEGDEAETEETDEEKERNSKPKYIDSADPNLLNADGLLISMPVDFDDTKTRQPRKQDFSDECDYMDWRAGLLETEANELVAMAAKMRETSTTMRAIGDPDKRAKVQKMGRLKAQLEKLEKWAEEEGVDL